MRVAQLMLIVMGGLALAACKSKPPTLPDASNTPAEESSANTGRTSDTDVTRGDPNEAAKQTAIQTGTIVYFDYDRAEIKPEFQEYALEDANQALFELKQGNIRGAKV